MQNEFETKAYPQEIENKPYGNEKAQAGQVEQAEVSHFKDAANFKADAVEAENAEHSMTVLQAVKAYPMACFWAFIMSFTIVCHLPSCPVLCNATAFC